MAQLSFSLDGDILKDGKPSLRTLGVIATQFQLAISRAYLDVKTGNVQKNSRVPVDEYENLDFWFSQTRKGSWVIDYLANTEWGERISQKISSVLKPIYTRIADGVERDIFDVDSYLQTNREKILHDEKKLPTFPELHASPPKGYSLGYVDKSISRYVSNALAPIRSNIIRDATIGIAITTEKTENSFFFDKQKARYLQTFATEKTYFSPILYNGRIFEMDSSKQSGYFYNLDNNGTKQKLIFRNAVRFGEAQAYFRKGATISFVGMPCIEAGSLDINSGDVLFVGVV